MLFWSDWGSNPRIEASGMDGSNRTVIIESDDVGWPNGLTIDYSDAKLYWIDARRDRMMKANFDGSEPAKVLGGLAHPFGLDVYNGFAYWSDWHDMAIYRINMSDISAEKEALLSNVGGLMEIRTYRSGLVSGKHATLLSLVRRRARTWFQIQYRRHYDYFLCGCEAIIITLSIYPIHTCTKAISAHLFWLPRYLCSPTPFKFTLRNGAFVKK